MLTLKLQNKTTGRIKIIECDSVDMVPTERGVEVLATFADSRPDQKYFVHEGHANSQDFDVAFVENAAGATTQIVRPSGNAARVRSTAR